MRWRACGYLISTFRLFCCLSSLTELQAKESIQRHSAATYNIQARIKVLKSCPAVDMALAASNINHDRVVSKLDFYLNSEEAPVYTPTPAEGHRTLEYALRLIHT